MNSNFRNFAIWVIIGILVLALFNMFQNGAPKGGNENFSYYDFLQSIEEGKVSDVVIAGKRISGKLADGGTFTIYAPEDPKLVDRLSAKGIKFSARPPKDEVPYLIGVLINWAPMALFIAIWIFFMRQMQSGGGRAMGFGKSKAKLLTERQGRVTFEDV
ncbi:MAG TPA: cell division protein FtsH, partial [Gammaproteobacteria bacterium]|nr:cell division protein FtsH [Gammaproteobacteria bacterium]